MVKLILNQKVKYKGETYPVNDEGITTPIPVETKDITFFQNNKMVVETLDDDGKKVIFEPTDQTAEALKAELEQKDRDIASMQEMINKLTIIQSTGSAEPDGKSLENLIKLVAEAVNKELIEEHLAKELKGEKRKPLITAYKKRLKELEKEEKSN